LNFESLVAIRDPAREVVKSPGKLASPFRACIGYMRRRNKAPNPMCEPNDPGKRGVVELTPLLPVAGEQQSHAKDVCANAVNVGVLT